MMISLSVFVFGIQVIECSSFPLSMPFLQARSREENGQKRGQLCLGSTVAALGFGAQPLGALRA